MNRGGIFFELAASTMQTRHEIQSSAEVELALKRRTAGTDAFGHCSSDNKESIAHSFWAGLLSRVTRHMDTLRGSAYPHQVRETKNKKLKLQQLVFQ